MTERFMVDDAGTLIDMVSRDSFDYVSDVCPVLNKYAEENEQLRTKNNAYIQDIEVFKEENTHLKLENEQLKQQIGELKYSKKILRENNKDLELGVRNLRKSFENFDNMRVEHIRFLQKRMKKYGISIYYNDDDGDVE